MLKAALANDIEPISGKDDPGGAEDPVDYLNKIAPFVFRAPIYHFEKEYEGVKETVADIKIGAVKPPLKK